MRTYHNVVKQAIVKGKILEYVRVGGNNVDNTNEEVKGKHIEEEEIKIPKCSRKSHVETVND